MRTRVLAAGALGAALTLVGSVTALEVALGLWDPVAGIGRRTPIQDTQDLPGLEPDTAAEMPAPPPEEPTPPSESEEPSEPIETPVEPDPPQPSGDTQEPVEQARPVDEDLRGIPVHSVAGVGREIVITFDDGPSIYTEEILAILGEKQVPAVFFWLAGNSRVHLAQQVVAQGHQLGSHTVGHVRLTDLTRNEQTAEVARSVEILEKAGGAPVDYFRPPYGSYSVDTLEMAKQLNLGMILWSVDSRDWDLADNPRQIIVNVLNQVKPGSIILLHERKQTVEVLPDLLDALRAEGYTFRLLPSVYPQMGPTMQADAETGQPLEGNYEAVPALQMKTGGAWALDQGTAPAQAADQGVGPKPAAGKGGAPDQASDKVTVPARSSDTGATGFGQGSTEAQGHGPEWSGDTGTETPQEASGDEPASELKAEAKAELGPGVPLRA